MAGEAAGSAGKKNLCFREFRCSSSPPALRSAVSCNEPLRKHPPVPGPTLLRRSHNRAEQHVAIRSLQTTVADRCAVCVKEGEEPPLRLGNILDGQPLGREQGDEIIQGIAPDFALTGRHLSVASWLAHHDLVERSDIRWLALADRLLKRRTVSETGGVVSQQRIKSILRTDELSQSDRVAARYVRRGENATR